jgi:hypothetical protein
MLHRVTDAWNEVLEEVKAAQVARRGPELDPRDGRR